MKTLNEILTAASIQSDFAALSDPMLSSEKDREKVNELIWNFLIKYLAVYLDILITDPLKLKAEIQMIVHFTVLAALSDYQETGDVDPASIGGDNYAIRCLADLRQTAAIFKEIVFGSAFKKGDSFFALDLGSGTGILSVVLVLAARRNGIKKIKVIGIERSSMAVDRARKAVLSLGLENVIEFQCEDLLSPKLIKKIVHSSASARNDNKNSANVQDDKNKLSAWVSETISIAIPKFDPFAPGFDLAVAATLKRKRELRSDPFVEVLKETVDVVPGFLDNVKRGHVAMFPDVVNGLYKPDGKRSTLTLKTGSGKPLPLERLGQEFENYEDLGLKHRRWGKEEDYK